MAARDCQKISLKTCATEQRGVCAGGKKPTARSIKQDFETFFESFKIRTAWRKDFFDTLRGGLYGRPRLSKNLVENLCDRAAGGVCGGQKAHRAFNQQDFETF